MPIDRSSSKNVPPAKQKRSAVRFSLKLIAALLLIAAFTLAGVIAAGYYYWAVNPLPATNGQLMVRSLDYPVTIARDQWGTPYLRAYSAGDLYFAQGYVTAQDRLWQMDLLRRASAGELAEIFGKDRLEYDRRQRVFGFRQVAERAAATAPPEEIAALAAYARGVNLFIETHSDRLPLEFRLLQYKPKMWTPVDSLLIGRLMSQVLSSSWDRDVFRGYVASHLDEKLRRELLPEKSEFDQLLVGHDEADSNSKATATTAPGNVVVDRELLAQARQTVEVIDATLAELGIAGEMAGSNNWVIGPKKSATGKPILANDPHLAHAIPSIWYAVSLQVPGKGLHVAGVVFPGIPGVIIGHNERIAWGVTNFWADVQDLYAEEFDPSHPNRYRAGSEWKEAEIRKEVILVRRTFLSAAADSVDRDVLVTRHGPIIAEREGKKLALKWTAFMPDDPFLTFSKLARASNWAEFTDALSAYPGPAQSFVYADVDGNIGFYAAGHVPIRSSGDGSVPYNGASGEGEWTRMIPFDELPHVFNPEKGWAATANNRLAGDAYPYFLSHEWVTPYREKRINDLIAARDKLTPEDVRQMQADVFSIQDDHFSKQAARFLARSARANEPKIRDIRAALESLDATLTPGNRTALIPSELRSRFTAMILRGKLGDRSSEYVWFNLPALIDNIVDSWPAEWLPKDYASYEDLLSAAYDQAVNRIGEQIGSNRSLWTWGKYNSLVFRHPLDQAPGLARFLDPPALEMGGASHTVNSFGRGRTWGVSMRLVVDLSNFDNSSLNLTVGESGQVASDHYKDQLADWYGVKPHLFPFSDKAVEAAIKETLVLKR